MLGYMDQSQLGVSFNNTISSRPFPTLGGSSSANGLNSKSELQIFKFSTKTNNSNSNNKKPTQNKNNNHF